MTEPVPVSKTALWAGRVISALPVLMLLFSASMKFTNSPTLTEGNAHLGWPNRLSVPLGIVELACTIIYIIPRTAVLGAVLLTGYLGGASAAHVRIGEPPVVQVLLGVLVWLGLFLRDRRVRALLPFRSTRRVAI